MIENDIDKLLALSDDSKELNRNYSTSWIEAIAVVRFDEKQGQVIESIFPMKPLPNSLNTKQLLQDLKMLAMPDCLESTDIHKRHEFMFMTRLRDKRYETSKTSTNHASPILNCYVAFRQQTDSRFQRGYFQQSIVIISKLPFIALFYEILSKLTDVLMDPNLEEIEHFTSLSESRDDNRLDNHNSNISIESILEVSYGHIMQWPELSAGSHLKLPFSGDIIQFSIPSIPVHTLAFNSNSHAVSDNDITGLFSSVSLIGVFRKLGLLPHLWTIWEQVITGQDIVVYSPSAAVCSSVVVALVSLLSPLIYGGDFRPYISPYDSDTRLFEKALSKNPIDIRSNIDSNNKQRIQMFDFTQTGESIYCRTIASSNSLKKSMILGITNPFLLKGFRMTSVALLIPNPESNVINSLESSSKSNRNFRSIGSSPKLINMFKKSMSNVLPSLLMDSPNTMKSPTGSTNSSIKSSSSSIKSPRSPQYVQDSSLTATSPKKLTQENCVDDSVLQCKVKILKVDDSIETVYDDWISYLNKASNTNINSKQVIFCLRSKPSIQSDENIEKRIQSILKLNDEENQEDNFAIANLLLREHFRSLNESLLQAFQYRNRINRSLYGNSIGIYYKMKDILSIEPINEDIESYVQQVSNQLVSLPACLRQSYQWKQLLTKFSLSDTYEYYSTWRKDIQLLQFIHELHESKGIMTPSGFDLLRDYAVEIKLYDVKKLTVDNIYAVLDLILQTIQALQVSQERLGSFLITTNDNETQIKGIDTNNSLCVPIENIDSNEFCKVIECMRKHVEDIIAYLNCIST